MTTSTTRLDWAVEAYKAAQQAETTAKAARQAEIAVDASARAARQASVVACEAQVARNAAVGGAS